MEAARSRNLISRAVWRDAHGDERAREALQQRLAMLSKLMFGSFLVLLVFLKALYATYPHLEPRQQDLIYIEFVGGLVILAIVWRIVLVRRPRTIRQLDLVDSFFAFGTGSSFGLAAYLSRELIVGPYSCLLYASFMVLLRAIVVPSSGSRTTFNGALTFVPVIAASVAIALGEAHTELPGPAYIAASVVVTAVVGALATIGSQVIYGLRRQVNEVLQLGQYTLDRKIGEGGMGAVYRAHHALLRRPTAVKLLLPDRVGANLARFEKEVQHTSQLTHPNTIAIFDYGRSPDGIFYYAMEYLDGVDLSRLARAYGPQPAARVVHILAQVCGALTEAHAVGLTHRDIKPANVILCERGGLPDVAKVVDFGLVKEMSPDSGISTQVVLGTPGYVAPEALTDPASVGPAADIYALGAVGYLLLTGKPVFAGTTALQICVQHVKDAPVPPSQVGAIHVPSELEAVIMACLAKQPAARPTAAKLAELLLALPSAGDWSVDAARAWWSEFRKLEDRAATASTPTMAIHIDLAGRDAS